MRLLQQQRFQQTLHSECSRIMEEDCLLLLKQKNQGQRKAIKIDNSCCLRCYLCGRLLSLSISTAPNTTSFSGENKEVFLGFEKSKIQIWGGGVNNNNKLKNNRNNNNNQIIIMSSKIGFHKICFDSINKN